MCIGLGTTQGKRLEWVAKEADHGGHRTVLAIIMVVTRNSGLDSWLHSPAAAYESRNGDGDAASGPTAPRGTVQRVLKMISGDETRG
jgi:hypothetical protein